MHLLSSVDNMRGPLARQLLIVKTNDRKSNWREKPRRLLCSAWIFHFTWEEQKNGRINGFAHWLKVNALDNIVSPSHQLYPSVYFLSAFEI